MLVIFVDSPLKIKREGRGRGENVCFSCAKARKEKKGWKTDLSHILHWFAGRRREVGARGEGNRAPYLFPTCAKPCGKKERRGPNSEGEKESHVSRRSGGLTG